MLNPESVCDLCGNGLRHMKKCYAGGISECLKDGKYTLFIRTAPSLKPLRDKFHELSQGADVQGDEYRDKGNSRMSAIRLGECNAYRHATDCIQKLIEGREGA